MTKITREDLNAQRRLCESLASALDDPTPRVCKREAIKLQIARLNAELQELDAVEVRLPYALLKAEQRLSNMCREFSIQNDPKLQELQRLQTRIDALMKETES